MGEVVSLDARLRERQCREAPQRHVYVYGDVEGMQVAAIAEGPASEAVIHVALVAPHPIGEVIVATLPGGDVGSEQADALADVVMRVLEVVDASYHAGGAA